MNRRHFMMTTGAIGLMAAMPALTLAQEIDTLEIFVPAAPGGGWDQTARVMDQTLRDEGLIGSARITNVGGAGGTIGLPQFNNQ